MRLIRWQRSDRPVTHLHIDNPTLSNDIGRTGCGKRYPIRAIVYAELVPDDVPPLDTGDICRSCLRAYQSEPVS